MRRRHPTPPRTLPKRWLMTDERMGDRLWDALANLPRGAGVVFRHYSLSAKVRRAMFAQVRRAAAKRGALVITAGRAPLGRGAAGTHGRHTGALTAPVHSRAEAIRATRDGARMIFVSPIFPTRSHSGERTLGRLRSRLIGQGLAVPVIALGGMNERRWAELGRSGFWGWAGIDAWLP